MIGVTITSPRFRSLAQKAQERFEEATGLPSVLVSSPVEKSYLMKFELHTLFHGQTVVYFDSDLWFINKCDLSCFDDQKEFLAVKDPGVYDPLHFPSRDCATLGIDAELYFNSGLLIWNDRHKELFPKALEIYRKNKHRLKDFGEQSSLNAAAQKHSRVRLISNSFNYMPFAEKEKLAGMEVLKNPLTLHAAGYGVESKQAALEFFESFYNKQFL